MMPPTRAFDRTCPSVFEDLALDEALLLEAEERDGPPVLRFWERPELAVVMGASCRLREAVNLDACRADGVPIARRASGGGTVLIGPGALNVAVVLPVDDAPPAVDEAQRLVLGRVAEALRAAGSPVEVLGSGDLALGGRKFSGSAQRRLKRRFLVHATILHDLPAATIARYLGAPPRRQPEYRAGRDHESFLTTCPLGRGTIRDAIREAWAPTAPWDGGGAEARVEGLVASKYADPSWIERF